MSNVKMRPEWRCPSSFTAGVRVSQSMKRLVLLLLLLVCTGVIALLGLHSESGTKERISWRSYQQIELGMTQQEVEDVTTVPPGVCAILPEGEERIYVRRKALSKGEAYSPKNYSWVDNEGHLSVGFDETGRVVKVSFTPLKNPRTFLQRLDRYLFGE